MAAGTVAMPQVETYSQAEIDAVHAKGGSVRWNIKAGQPRVTCRCGCGSYLPASTAMQLWVYIRGHKPTSAGVAASPARSVLTKPSTIELADPKSYEGTIARLRMDIAQVRSEVTALHVQKTVIETRTGILGNKLERLQDALRALEGLGERFANGGYVTAEPGTVGA